ncbi:hypothetical protein [Eubacterium oxidoreducens]|uniref:SbsA Ig-like domain-containing protein n=1 Tax=Eubacterium oxidoreducens TaxID=1732 RepID=A0A1G6BNP2_EUBOX|nr:hypothetical protein [Eubacterium oxidoreducens]SDB22286.1 hypothetical protein SAMN02910417_01678 [Eubacterium oxidoreducens]
MKKILLLTFLAIFIISTMLTGCSSAKYNTDYSPHISDITAAGRNEGSESSQFVDITLTFNQTISLSDDPLANMDLTIGGKSPDYDKLTVTQNADNALTIAVPVTAITTGNLVIDEKKENTGYTGILNEDASACAYPFSCELLIPSGISLTTDESYSGGGTKVQVEGTWDIRSITWLELLSDGSPVTSQVSDTSELYQDTAIAVHGHDFLLCDETMIAETIAETLTKHFGSSYAFYANGSSVTCEKLDNTDTAQLELKIYTYKTIKEK